MSNRTWLSLSSSEPLGQSDRVFGASEFAVLIASVAFGAPALLIGLDLLGAGSALSLTVSQLILVAPLGIVFAAALVAAVAWAASENGVPTGLLLRPALGVAGSWLAMAAQVTFLLCWIAIELDFGGEAVMEGLRVLGVEGVSREVAAVGIAVIAAGFLIAGLSWVTRIWLYRFAFWAAIVLVIVLAWTFLSTADLGNLMDATPTASNFWLGVDAVTLLGVIWFPVIGDTARFVSGSSAAASGAGSGFAVIALILVLLGGLRAATSEVAATDPALLLVDGLTSFGAVIVVGWLVVATVDQPFILSFSSTTALSTIHDRFAGRLQTIAILLVGLAIALQVPITGIRQIAELTVVVIAQLLAVLLADFFVVRHRYYETDHLYRRKGTYAGVNLYGLVAVLVGFLAAVFISPVGPEGFVSWINSVRPGDTSPAEAGGVPPIIVSMLVTFIIYTILGRWKIHDRVMVSKMRV